MLATSIDVIFVVGIAVVSLVYLPDVVGTDWLPVLVLGCGPKISIIINSRGPEGLNNSKFV